jgi:hypothetical protein
MPKISEAEARALLSRPLRCEGDFAWKRQKDQLPGWVLCAGIIDDAGRGTHLAVELNYTRSAAKTRYVFSVVMLNRSSTERVYQLDVNHRGRKLKDAHAMSHEHIGDRRLIGQAGWQP